MDPLIAYIHKEKFRGFSDELIMQKMKASGYSTDEITVAFKDFYSKEHYHKFIDRIVEEETKHKWLFLVLALIGIILLTLILLIGAQLLYSKTALFSFSSEQQEKTTEPQQETDCASFTHRDKERCLLKIAALFDDTSFCVNMTSKVMGYECKTSVWKKNHCNFLILTNQSTTGC